MLLSFYTDGRSSNIQTGNSTMQPEFTQPNEAPPGYKASQECQARSLLRYADDYICFNCVNLVNTYVKSWKSSDFSIGITISLLS